MTRDKCGGGGGGGLKYRKRSWIKKRKSLQWRGKDVQREEPRNERLGKKVIKKKDKEK